MRYLLAHIFLLFRLIGGIAIVLNVVSCNGKEEYSEVKTIDSLCIILKGTDSLLDTIKPEKAEEIAATIDENLKALKNNLDSINQEQANLLNKYAEVKGQVETFVESSDKLEKEIAYSHNQLTALKTDLVNGLIEEEYFTQYLANEKKEVEKIQDNANNLVNLTLTTLNSFDSLNQAVIEIKHQTEKDTIED